MGDELNLPQIGEDEPVVEQTFLGDYKTREDAEKALADLKAERDRQAQEAERLRIQMDAMMTRVEPPRYEAPKPEPEFPDPVVDPEGYKRAMQDFRKTVSDDIAAQKAALDQREQEREAQAFAESLWNDFKNRYHDEGLDDEVLVAAIANRESQAIRDAGGDPARYVRQNREAFIERVASNVRAHVSRYREKPENRTAGIPGGTTAPTPRSKEPPVPSFIDQIKEARLKAETVF